MRFKAVLLTSAVVLPVLLAEVLPACVCAEFFDARQGFNRSDLVFRGRVTAVSSVQIPQHSWFGEPGKDERHFSILAWQSVVTFEVLDRWKGNAGSEEFFVLAGAVPERQSIEDCDAHFELDREYLVFASGENMTADPCSPTGPFNEAGEDVAVLNKLTRRK